MCILIYNARLLLVTEYSYSVVLWCGSKYFQLSSQELCFVAVLPAMIDREGNPTLHTAANAAESNIIERQNASNQPLQFHSSTLIQFPFTVPHNCFVFFALRLSITSSWSNSSDSEAVEKLPGAAWLLYLWPLVFDLSVQLPSESYCSVLGGGNLIATGHPGLPPLTRGLYPEQGHGVSRP